MDGPDGEYLGIKVLRFYFKCITCSAEFTIKTDPKNMDYAVEAGVRRNFELYKAEEKEKTAAATARAESEKDDPMAQLENKTKDSKVEMDILDALDEIRTQNARSRRSTPTRCSRSIGERLLSARGRGRQPVARRRGRARAASRLRCAAAEAAARRRRLSRRRQDPTDVAAAASSSGTADSHSRAACLLAPPPPPVPAAAAPKRPRLPAGLVVHARAKAASTRAPAAAAAPAAATGTLVAASYESGSGSGSAEECSRVPARC